MERLFVTLALVPMLACGDGDPAPLDAGDDATSDADALLVPPVVLSAITPPLPPAVIDLRPCPAGAMEVTEGGAIHCVLDEGPCPAGEIRFPGSGDDCVPISRPCPEGDFAERNIEYSPLYVRLGATGNGTRDAPFGSIAEALAAAEPMTEVLLAKGTYDGPITIPDGVAVTGACAAETIIRGPAGEDGVIRSETQSDISDVTIRADNVAFVVRRGSLFAEDVLVERAKLAAGIAIGPGILVVTRVHVKEIVPREDGAEAGFFAVEGGIVQLNSGVIESARVGVQVESGGDARLEQMVLSGPRGAVQGVSVDDGDALLHTSVVEGFGNGVTVRGEGSTLVVRRTFIRNTVVDPLVETSGRGVQIGEGASAQIEHSELRDIGDIGVLALGETTLTQVIVRNAGGRAISIGGADTSVEIDGLLIDHAVEHGIRVNDRAHLRGEDIVIRDVAPDDAGYGAGVDVRAGARADADRVQIDRAHAVGIVVDGPSMFTGTDLAIRDTASNSVTRHLGVGLAAQHDARAELRNVVIERMRDCAIVSVDDATITASDVWIDDVQPRASDGYHGIGAAAELAGIELARARIGGTAGTSVLSYGGRITLEDVEIAGTELVAEDDPPAGVVAEIGGQVTIDRARVHDVASGILAVGEDSIVTATDIEVDDIGAPCERCGGIGLGAFEDAHIELSRFAVRRSALCGVYAAAPGLVSLDRGRVAECAVAVCLASGSDLSGLETNVEYRDNVSSLEARELAAPRPAFMPFAE